MKLKLSQLLFLILLSLFACNDKTSESKMNDSNTTSKKNTKEKLNETNMKENTMVLIEIIKTVRSKISDSTDVSWSGFESVNELQTELDKDIISLESGDFSSLKTYKVYFLPTGEFQEISMSNGWGEEYLKLANKFDEYYKKIQ